MTPYEVLGIKEGATPAQIKAAFRRKARETHPDTGGSAQAFQAVHDAYEQLTQPPMDQGERTRTLMRIKQLEDQLRVVEARVVTWYPWDDRIAKMREPIESELDALRMRL